MKAIDYLRTILENSCFTQKDIAICLGVDQSTISKWLSGERKMDALQFSEFCDVLGYSSADYLNETIHAPFSLSFSASNLSVEDIIAIGRLTKMVANINYMEMIDGNEARR